MKIMDTLAQFKKKKKKAYQKNFPVTKLDFTQKIKHIQPELVQFLFLSISFWFHFSFSYFPEWICLF